MQPLESPAVGAKQIVIMGCDGLGNMVTMALADQGHTLHVIDTRSEAFDQLPSTKVQSGQIVPIVGDGTTERDLRRAEVQDADIFLALTKNDTKNALAAQMARHIYQVPLVVCRIDSPSMKKMYNQLGIIAVSANSLAADMIVNAVNV